MTTINLPASSSELAVGVHLVTHPILQRDHVSRSGLRSALGSVHLERTAAPDLSNGASRRQKVGVNLSV